MDIIEPIELDVPCDAGDVAHATRYFETCRDFLAKHPKRAGS